jgi:hypothetical protein
MRTRWIVTTTTTGTEKRPAVRTKKIGLNQLDNFICHLAAWGLKNCEIEKQARTSPIKITNVLTSVEGQARIREIQKEVWGTDAKKWLERILTEAIQTAYDVMTHPEAKHSVRLAAAQDFMDRSMGKAQQRLTVEDSTMRSVIERLDRIAQLKESGAPKDIVDAEFKVVQDNEEKRDEVDKWMSEEYAMGGSSQKATSSSG